MPAAAIAIVPIVTPASIVIAEMVTPDGAPVTTTETAPAKPPPRVMFAVTLELSPGKTCTDPADRDRAIDGLSDVGEPESQAAAIPSTSAVAKQHDGQTGAFDSEVVRADSSDSLLDRRTPCPIYIQPS